MKKIIFMMAIITIIAIGGSQYIKYKRVVQAKKAMAEISLLFIEARAKTNLSLDKITNNGCSFCPCRTGESHLNDPVNTICVYNWNNVMILVWRELGREGYPPDQLMRDPWGSPYGVDEDDSGAKCLADKLVCFGPDGRYGTPDDIEMLVRDPECK